MQSSRGIGKLKTYSHIYYIEDIRENGIIIRHTFDRIYQISILYRQHLEISLPNYDNECDVRKKYDLQVEMNFNFCTYHLLCSNNGSKKPTSRDIYVKNNWQNMIVQPP